MGTNTLLKVKNSKERKKAIAFLEQSYILNQTDPSSKQLLGRPPAVLPVPFHSLVAFAFLSVSTQPLCLFIKACLLLT